MQSLELMNAQSQLGMLQYSLPSIVTRAIGELPGPRKTFRRQTSRVSLDRTVFQRMQFGLMSGPASFQRMLNIQLLGHRCRSCLIYLDDIIIFSKDVYTYIKDVTNILAALKRAGVSLKLRNCRFFKRDFEYLGHRATRGELLINHNKTAALAETRPARTKTQL